MIEKSVLMRSGWDRPRGVTREDRAFWDIEKIMRIDETGSNESSHLKVTYPH